MLEIPKDYQEPLKSLSQLYNHVEKTHSGCGKLAVFEILVDASNSSALIISSSGTGKSVVMKMVSDNVHRDKMILDSVTVAGLKHLAKRLSGSHYSMFVDDISKGGTEYSQVQTVTALGELVYSGFAAKYNSALNLSIENFKGSAIMNAQPLMLKRILRADEFETDIRDKVFRYYHLHQPVKIMIAPPKDPINYTYDYKNVNLPSGLYTSKLWNEGIRVFQMEFKKARSEEHLTALIKTSALINGRTSVEQADIWLVNNVCKCFYMETELFNKKDLEGERLLDVNIIPLISYIVTFGEVAMDKIVVESQVKIRRLYEILEMNRQWVRIIKSKGKQVMIPTPACKQLLKQIGEM